jgi:hypothetical protein
MTIKMLIGMIFETFARRSIGFLNKIKIKIAVTRIAESRQKEHMAFKTNTSMDVRYIEKTKPGKDMN